MVTEVTLIKQTVTSKKMHSIIIILPGYFMHIAQRFNQDHITNIIITLAM